MRDPHRIDGRPFHENITVVDPNFFQVIKLPLVERDLAHALDQSAAVVLSQSTARCKQYSMAASSSGRRSWWLPCRRSSLRAIRRRF